MMHKEFSDPIYYPGHPATVYGAKVSRMILDQYLALEESDQYTAANAELICQLELLSEMEQPSLVNIF